MTDKKGVKKGSVVVVDEKMAELIDKQGIPRKAMRKCEVSANAFSSVQWYGVKITGGEKYYVDKAVGFGAEKAVVAK